MLGEFDPHGTEEGAGFEQPVGARPTMSDMKLQVLHRGPRHPHRTEGSWYAAEDAGDVLRLP